MDSEQCGVAPLKMMKPFVCPCSRRFCVRGTIPLCQHSRSAFVNWLRVAHCRLTWSRVLPTPSRFLSLSWNLFFRIVCSFCVRACAACAVGRRLIECVSTECSECSAVIRLRAFETVAIPHGRRPYDRFHVPVLTLSERRTERTHNGIRIITSQSESIQNNRHWVIWCVPMKNQLFASFTFAPHLSHNDTFQLICIASQLTGHAAISSAAAAITADISLSLSLYFASISDRPNDTRTFDFDIFLDFFCFNRLFRAALIQGAKHKTQKNAKSANSNPSQFRSLTCLI